MTDERQGVVLTEFEKKRIEKSLSDFPGLMSEDVESISSVRNSGRMFSITRLGCEFYPYEYEPISIMLAGETQENADKMIVELMGLYTANPNGFLAYCLVHDIDQDDMCFLGGELGTGAIGYSNLNEAISVVFRAIESNVVIKSSVTLEEADEELQGSFYDDELARLLNLAAYWEAAMIFEGDEPQLVSDKTNSKGEPLSREERGLLMNYLNAPTLSLWRHVCNVELTPTSSVWSVLTQLKASTPNRLELFDDDNIPDNELFASILFKAVPLHNIKCKRQGLLIEERIAEEQYLFREHQDDLRNKRNKREKQKKQENLNG